MSEDSIKQDRRQLFAKLQSGDQAGFFARVADNVNWTVMETHPLAGNHRTKEDFLDHTFRQLDRVLHEWVRPTVEHLYVDGDTTHNAMVMIESL